MLKPSRLAAAVFALAFPATVLAQDSYPAGPVTLVVPYPPGSVVDIVAREISGRLGEKLGSTVAIENTAGGGGSIGTLKVSRATPNGQTLLFHSETTMVVNDAMKGGKDPLHEEVLPVVAVIRGIQGIYVNPKVPATTLQELIDHAKAHPGEVHYGSSGAGTITHLSGVLLAEQAGIELTHIPYQGGAPSVTATISGEVEMVILPYGAVKSQVEAGSLRAIAIAGDTRDPQLPNVPTTNESGLPDYSSYFQLGIFAPPGTPDMIVSKVNAGMNEVIADPAFVKAMGDLSYMTVGGSPDDFLASVKAEYEKYLAIATSAGLAAN